MTTEKKSIALLFVALGSYFIFHVVSLGTVPLHGDELFFQEQASLHNDSVTGFFRSSFEQFRFYRILGRPINFLVFAFADEHPTVMTGVLTAGVLLLLLGYAHILLAFFDEDETTWNVRALLCLLFLAVPFSFYLTLLRVVNHEIVTIGLMLLGIWVLRLPTGTLGRRASIALITTIYALSLFIYESSVLMLIFIVYLAMLSSGEARSPKFRYGLTISLVAAASLYLVLQVVFVDRQPKLSDVMATYAPYSVGLRFEEQVLRMVFYAIYHLKWSFRYIVKHYSLFTVIDLISVAAYLLASVLSFAILLGTPGGYLRRDRWQQSTTAGALLFMTTFGLWLYYWVFKRTVVLPPFYTMFLPSIGVALTAVGLFTRYQQAVRGSAWIRGSIIALYAVLLTINLALFLSSRLAITVTSLHMESFASAIDGQYRQREGKIKIRNIILLDLPADAHYARRKARYESMLKAYLVRRNPSWSQVDLIATAMRQEPAGSTISLPLRKSLISTETLLLRYEGQGNLTRITNVGNASAAVDNAGQDPYRIRGFGYELAFNVNRDNVVLRKLTSPGVPAAGPGTK